MKASPALLLFAAAAGLTIPAMAGLPSDTLENRSDQVIDLFIQVCLKGDARFRKDEVEKVGSSLMPWRMGWNTDGHFYRVKSPVEAWVAVRDKAGGSPRFSRRCRVGAKYAEVRTAADRVRAYLHKPPLPRGTDLAYYEEYYLDRSARFEAEAQFGADFVILTSYVLTPEAAERARRTRGR
jgi:hypothetical protein